MASNSSACLSARANIGLARNALEACFALRQFLRFSRDLASCTNYRLLSNVQMQGDNDDAQLESINVVVSRITADVAQPFFASDFASELGMSESHFSRFFRRATGNTSLRLSIACVLIAPVNS